MISDPQNTRHETEAGGSVHPPGRRGRVQAPAQAYPLPGARAGAGWRGGESWLAQGWQIALQWAHAEAGPGRLFPWIPVAFGIGIALYFTAEREPALIAALAAALILTGSAWLSRRQARLFPIAALIAALACGFAAATLKAAYVAHPVLTRTHYKAALTGYVETREVRERSDRFVLRVVTLEAGRNIEKIERVRLTVRKGQGPQVGAFVSLNARLSPPLPPSRPGGYDFARDMYFQGIGASGFVLGKISVTQAPLPGGWRLAASSFLQDIRDGVDKRISAFVQGDARAIASALLTGRRDAISAPVNDAMFVSGLGHVLSISGYHMAVVAGVVFFIVRLMLALMYALVPSLAGSAHAKRVAAMIAFVAAAFYLALSGAEVATIRSFVMTGIVLAGIMVDRRAITFRTLALAALFVLATTPEALVHPSFQMSFAATLAIVALIDRGMPTLLAKADDAQGVRLATWGAREVIALLLVSLVAGLATTPSAAYHFHRVTPYGAIANLLAMPVISLWVMPAGLLGLATIPFGFDGVFWRLMEGGILWMTSVAQGVANLPGALGPVPEFSTGLLLLACFGIVILCLLRGPLRLVGAGLIIASSAMAFLGTLPDIRVAPDGRSVAVRGMDGRIRIMEDGRNAFTSREWLAADADRRLIRDESLAKDVACDAEACHTQLQGYGIVALVRSPRAMEEDCARAALIVSRHTPPHNCKAAVIGPDEWRHYGAMNLYREAGSNRSGKIQNGVGLTDEGLKKEALRVMAARPTSFERPWTARAQSSPYSPAGEIPSQSPPAGEISAPDQVPRAPRVSSIQNGYVHLPASRAEKRARDAPSSSTIFRPDDAEDEQIAPEAQSPDAPSPDTPSEASDSGASD